MTKPNTIWPHDPPHDGALPADHVWLRLLETTDVHAHLMPFDYATGQDNRPYGLTRTATRIAQARAQAANTLLFDNGDFLQGSALSDLVAAPGTGWTDPHPVIAAMNALDYTAANLGNHEFNFGLEWLRRSMTQAHFPVLCANALTRQGDDPLRDETLGDPCLLLPVTAMDASGATTALKIGLIGVLPSQITTWDHAHLAGRVTARDMVDTARARIAQAQSLGADLIILLAHTGISPAPATPHMENAALALAELPGVDALLTGHTHHLFPDAAQTAPDPRIDPVNGTLAGVPAVMAGFRGAHLGVIDLCLTRSNDTWQIAAHKSALMSVAEANPDPALTKLVQPAHAAALRITARPVGHTPTPLHSYLAQVRPCPTLAPVLAAQQHHLAEALADTSHGNLPVLAAAAPFKTGGNGGPGYYTDIPAGQISLRHVSDIYPFPNTLVGLCLTGADLRDWLERAASAFHRIQPGQRSQPLWNPEFAGHGFDTILGLTYRIDLSQPAGFDARGTACTPAPCRIRDLCFDGAPVDPQARFVLATNNFRAYGGGPYRSARPDQVIYTTRHPIRDMLTAHLEQGPLQIAPDYARTWSFLPLPGTSVELRTGPGLGAHPCDMAGLDAHDHGLTQDGFMRLELPL